MTDVAAAPSPSLVQRAGLALLFVVFACPWAVYRIWRNLVWRLLDLDVRWSSDPRAAIAVVLELGGSVVIFIAWAALLVAAIAWLI